MIEQEYVPPPPGGDLTIPAPFGAPAAPERHAFHFSGRGGEYFGIWIVNLILTVLSIGIYSAWAKVRRMQYFYRNTTLAEASFDYHGDPRAILKGRLIVFALLAVYNIAATVAPLFAIVIFVGIAGILPILLLRSLRFRAVNSSWSGLRFGFDGTQRGAYNVFLKWPLLCGLTLYLLGPMWHQRLKAFQHNNARYGATHFEFNAPISAFYGVYIVAFVVMLAGGAIIGMFGWGLVIASPMLASLIPLAFMLLLLFIQPFLMAKLQNLVWNHTRLGPHRFESHVASTRLFWIVITNLLGIVLTLGLFQPFAAIRLARYRIESMTLIAGGPIDDFVAGQQQAVGATGEGAADLFDIDIAL